MTTALRVLGQLAPAAATPDDLYPVPGATQVLGSSIMVCNRSATATKFRVSVRPAAAAQADEHYIYYDTPISGFNTFEAKLGLTLGALDVVTVYATDATLSFSLFGQEIT